MIGEGEAAFIAHRMPGSWKWGVLGPDGTVKGWGSYASEGDAREAAARLERAYRLGGGQVTEEERG